jgi:Icc-related predicted phosphoesterase
VWDALLRLLCVSDKVSDELDQPGAAAQTGGIDLILSCGDLPPEYLTRLTDRFRAPLYYVRGNHDIRYKQSPPLGCINAHNKIVKYRGLRILGLDGSRWYNAGPYQYTEAQMRRMVRAKRIKLWWQKGVDIIMTHAPPRHIGDLEDMCHRGFRVYNRLIKRHQPRYFLHGHVHKNFSLDAERITASGATKIINCYKYYIIDTDND